MIYFYYNSVEYFTIGKPVEKKVFSKTIEDILRTVDI